MSSNQVSINMERVFKLEDDFEKLRDERAKEIAELLERKEKRQAVVAKHKEVLDAMIIGKQKGIRFRRYFYKFVFSVSEKDFQSEEDEYECIGKPDRRHWTERSTHLKSFKATDPMHAVIWEIMEEFGCFEY